jgi:hypothetical protein
MTEKSAIVLFDCAASLIKQRLGRFYSVLLHNYLCETFVRLREDTSGLCLLG